MALTKSQRSLFDAVKSGSLAKVKPLLKKVPDLDFEGDFGRTPLEQAIVRGHVSIVKALVEAGADINRINDDGQTPLDLAKSYRETGIAKFLDDEGAYKAKDKPVTFPGYDDDDHYFSRGFGDDDDDWGSKRGSAKKSRGTAKQTARKFTTAANGKGGAAKPEAEKANQPVQPKFSEETLKDVFNPKSWAGKTEEMQQLWQEVPLKLQKTFDFDAAFAEAKRETLKKNAPHVPKLSLQPPPVTRSAENHPVAAPDKIPNKKPDAPSNV